MTTLSARPKAIVVGGSLGGLFAANLLNRSGWQVDVFERVPEELAGRVPVSSRTPSCSRHLLPRA
jgi:2-polyprenyl-6-methoxyphenol hydroxylase-like FAD-dependent oxidoreductase